MADEWWKNAIREYELDGRRDADLGRFMPPYPGETDDPTDQEFNMAYERGFNTKRTELGDAFQWR
jgi:hypothetical protein